MSSVIQVTNPISSSLSGVALSTSAAGGAVTIVSSATYAISGTISPAAGGAGATVTLSGASSASTTTTSSGTYSFSGLANGSYVVTPSLHGYSYTPSSAAVTISGANQTANFTAQPASGGVTTHFSVVAPPNATAGSPIQFTVTALDANNNTAVTYSDPVRFTSTDGSAALPMNVTLANGVGTFSASLVTPGLQRLTATDSLLPSITGASGSVTVSAAAGLSFVPVTPCRVVDTRVGPGPFGPPFLAGQTSRSFPILDGPCGGIPATTQAYSFNLTAVPHQALGYLTIWPTGQNQPTVSTLNSDGRIKANAVIVPAGRGGAVSVFATDDTDLILDINGYFVSNTTLGALAFYPLPPCRIADTRPGQGFSGSFGPPMLGSGTSRTLPILSSSCNVPANAQAYSLNFTVAPQSSLGWLTTWPTGQTQPTVSTLNDLTGTMLANAAIVKAGMNGSVDLYVSDNTDVMVDINGYFAPRAAGGLSLYPLPPCRVLDTRYATGPFNGSIDVNVLGGVCGGTPAVQTYALNATVVPQPTLAWLTLYAQGAALPNASTLNAADGAVTSNMAIVSTRNTEVSAFASGLTNLILDLSGYFAP